MCVIFMVLVFIVQILADSYSMINLPPEHLPYYFASFPKIKERCLKDDLCPFKKYLNRGLCWGYEHTCKWDEQYSIPVCSGDHRGWVQTKFDQQTTFYTQADFGYVKQQLQEMRVLCAPLFPDDSSLECTQHLQFCRGRNILLNLTKLASKEEPVRYKMDVLSDGDIGGYCDFNKAELNIQVDHISPLQSWGPEMRYFTRLNRRPIVEGDCDVVIEKPTFIMKIDATVNMYHHFCDFFNLYASLHLNASHEDAFSTDIYILIWETFTYHSAFEDTWKAFTNYPIIDLKAFRGKTVCFKNVVFPLLPRMIFGLFYNTPIIYGCDGSGLFDAFSKHILHRLKIPILKRVNREIRITFLSRETKYRRVLNENELLDRLRENDNYVVIKAVYDKNMSFIEQLHLSRNSDVLIGIHGAGLTHLLFLPEWAAVFELYNCEDINCYFDLARLKGVYYVTWKDTNKLTSFEDGTYNGGAHAKFANYSFDIEEFERLVEIAANHVKNHPKFRSNLRHTDEISSHDEL